MSLDFFLNESYQRHNRRRQEHLASLSFSFRNKTVLEVGAGIGDHTSFFLDRGASVTLTDARQENVQYAALRYPGLKTAVYNLDSRGASPVGIHDVVYAYGLLYHLQHPSEGLAQMAGLAKEMLLLETCVSFGQHEAVNLVNEDTNNPTQAAHGVGCRPTRYWVFSELKKYFPFVYCTKTQPFHDEFPTDWTASPPENGTGLYRYVFVASRLSLGNPLLSETILDIQVKG
jgi:Methyltransferase domain